MLDLNTLKVENLQKWFVEDSKIWIPPANEIHGGNRILALFRAIFKRYENIEWKVSQISDLGNDRFFYETVSIGKMFGKEEFTNHICTVVEFTDSGKIKFLSDYFKDTTGFS